MSQDHQDKDRREFIRQSLGVAPLLLTLSGHSYDGKTSMHGTLWSSLGTKWKHEKDWFGGTDSKFSWSKKSGDKYSGKDDGGHRDYDDYVKDERSAKKDWSWDDADAHWKKELDATTSHKEIEAKKDHHDYPKTDHDYDWRDDEAWKRSEGLSPFGSKSD